jgi:hypothetical protein
MKKKMLTLLAGALMTLSMAGNALAYFEYDHLIRVVYDQTTMTEVATDLGAISSLMPAAGSSITLGDSYLVGNLATASFDNLKVAYFGINVTNKDLYLSSSADTQSLSGTTSWTAGSSAINSVLTTYKAAGTSTDDGAMSYASSYWQKLDGNGTKVGKFNTFYSTANGEMSLAALSSGGTVSQNLFFFDTPSTTGQIAGAKLDFTIQTLADGSTVIASSLPAPSNVPVPAAAYLLGSGLMGLVGVRRKINKA